MPTAQSIASVLPALNALLNATCAVCLLFGRHAMRRHRMQGLHRRWMLGALGVSAVFLVSYSVRVALSGTHRFPDLGWVRSVYLLVLGSHTILAAALLPLVLRVVYLAWRGSFEQHRGIARATWWIWMYVSATGVLVYLMLYQVAPALLPAVAQL